MCLSTVPREAPVSLDSAEVFSSDAGSAAIDSMSARKSAGWVAPMLNASSFSTRLR